MIRSRLIVHSKEPASVDFTDSSVDEAVHRLRNTVHDQVALTRKDDVPREFTVFIGQMPDSHLNSMPRKPSKITSKLGLDPVSLAGIVDLSVRTLHHPAIRKVEFNNEKKNSTVIVTDYNGKEFEITIKEK